MGTSTIWILVGVVVVFVLYILVQQRRTETNRPSKKKYEYLRKASVMTEAETQFFKRLEAVAGDRYYIFPQVHLDSLLDHTVKGQNWKSALSAVQRKSVDYVLADKQTLQTVYAVELDDWSHNRDDRTQRDLNIETILSAAGVKLVRFRDTVNMSDGDIAKHFYEVAHEIS